MERPLVEKMLKGCPLFRGADDKAIGLIADSLIEDSVKKGDPIILEGQISDHVYFIASGSVEIMKYRPEFQMIQRVTLLKAGNYFSEFSVLNRVNKSASAFALENSILLRMDGATFLNLVQKFPGIAHHLVETLAELNSQSGSSSDLDYFDSAEIEFNTQIAKSLPNLLWKKFGVLPLNFHAGILHVAAKDPHRPDFFQYCQTAWPNVQINLVLIGHSDFEQTFKKMSRLYSNSELTAKAPTTVRPTTDESIADCLKRTPYFENAEDAGLIHIAKLFEVVDLEAGAAVFQPDEPSEYFYIVQAGRVELNHRTVDKVAWTGLRVRKAGSGFGEVSLLLNQPHGHWARAAEPTRILRMSRENFLQFLGSSAFCLNLAKVLALRLQSVTDNTPHRFFDETKPLNLKELGKLIPKQTMTLQQIIPLRLEGKDLTLGIVNPGNEAIYSVAHRYFPGCQIHAELMTVEKFNQLLSQSESVSTKVVHEVPAVAAADGTVLELNKLIVDGFEARASDMHLEPTGTGYSVRYRIDGVLSEAANHISVKAGESLVNRIKVLSHLDISNHFTPQDGQLKIVEDNRDMQARIATTPTKQGEGVVMRLIRSRNSAMPLNMLTPDPRTIKALRSISRLKQGLFLMTGPTGSGKTTTLYSLIAELNRVDVKIISIEDPVELEIPGVTQIEVNEKTGLTFDRALRSTLRQDPDVMVLGEIRDAESAKSVFEAALQGHLVVSTLHTNNSFAVKNRLKELGVPMATIAAGLVGSMAQRLVRAVCKKCRQQRPVTASEQELLAARLHIPNIPSQVWCGTGCMACNQTGFQGRLPIIEIWQKTRAMEELLTNDAPIDALLQESKHDGFLSLFEAGLMMALNGLTTIEEIERCMYGNL